MNTKTLLLLSLSLLTSACNRPDEYFPITASADGPDSYCIDSPDQESCEAKSGCQSAFEDSEGSEPNVYSACVANPDEFPPEDGETTGETTAGATTGETTGGTTTGGTTTGGTTTGGTTTGGTTTGGTTTGGTTTGGTVGDEPPSIDDTVDAKCENLRGKYLLIQRLVSKKETKVIKKVKICHKTGNHDAHTIIIACPAVKAHQAHHDDYLGACEN